MATPQRNFPNEPRPEARRVDPVPARPVRTGGSRSFFWLWVVLFIAAIIWFCGWGWGGYGGWWWGRTPAVYQPASRTGTGAGTATGTGTASGAANGTAPAAPHGTGNGTAAQQPAAPPK